MLNRNNIKMIQITLDGTESEHDKSRPLTSGGNTFKRILSNIKLNYEFINELVIRVNIDKTNDKNFKELTRIIKEIDRDNKIRMSISKIENTNSAYFEDKCYSNEEFIDFQINEVSKIDEDLTNVLYPRKRNRYCIADGLYGMVVAHNGLIYKCWSDIGNEKNAIGDINKFVTFINDNILESYYEFDPTNDKDCSVCKFLPICIGGCPKRRIDDGKKSCLYTKESFSKIIKSFYTGKSI